MATVLFGGTFDPPHRGHERMIDLLRDAFPGVPVELLPCYQPVHKKASGTSARHRVAMARLLAYRWPDVSVNTIEVDSEAPRYTLDTLQFWRRAVSKTEPLLFALGGDSLAHLHSWSRWDRLPELAHLVVLPRPGYTTAPPEPEVARLISAAHVPLSERYRLLAEASGRVVTLSGEALPWSSTNLRNSRENWRAALPAGVLNYMHDHCLYGIAGDT